MSDYAKEDNTFFPPELVGRPTSEVLKYLSATFQEYSDDVEVLEELTDGICTGYTYASNWLFNWAKDCEKIEEERRRSAR